VLDPTQPGISTQTDQISAFGTLADGKSTAFNWCEKSFEVAAGDSSALLINDNCGTTKSNAFIADSSAKTCSGLNVEDDAETSNTAGFEIMDSDGTITGISLIFEGGVCGTGKFNLNVTAMCPADGKNSKEAPLVLESSVDATNPCNFFIVYMTPNGCPVFSLSQVSRFFYKYSYLFGAVLIAAGFFLAFFGNKFVNVVIFMVSSFALIIVGSGLFINLALEKVDKEWVVWTAFVIIVLISIGCGLLLVKFRKYGVGLFAAWGGVMLGFVVTTTFAVKN